jgi:acyl-CoA thioester hydrolase
VNLPTARTEIQLRYSDIDTIGHVSNTVYCVYLELGRIEWFLKIPGERVPSVVANLNINYLGEIRIEDRVYVITRCTKVGNKSIQMSQEVYANDRCVTTAVVVLVGFDPQTRKTAPLLAGWEPSLVEDLKADISTGASILSEF